MTRPIRLSDVAKAAGVSHGTASNAFNRPEIVRDEVRQRIMKVAKELGYAGPDPKGRLLRAGKFNAIGVVVFDALPYFFEDPYARRFMAGIAAACDARGAGLSLVSATNDESAAWTIQSALVDGFILDCMMVGTRLIDLAKARGIPFVALDIAPVEGVDTLNVDDREGARLAARHLVDLGHRRFGVLSLEFDLVGNLGPADASRLTASRFAPTRNRLRGYVETIGGAPPLVYDTVNDEASAAAGVADILDADPAVTAFLCMSDVVALAAIRALAARGLRVPEDVSVVGFDDIPEAALSDPPLTTVAQPIAEKAAMAVDMLYNRPTEAGRSILLPLSLAVRGSTAAPPPAAQRRLRKR
jgi:DNA-binding LacI/PurR family transcriptional regulator